MRLRKALWVALVMLAITSAARSRLLSPSASVAASGLLNGRTPVPGAVMSTLRAACFDCHSDETRWPWYAALPLVSHLVERDVADARGQINLSRWMQYNPFDRADMLDKMCQLATSGTMPPWQYRMMHPQARLSTTDVATLCAWSQAEATRLVQREK
jgi:hypothetical protein